MNELLFTVLDGFASRILAARCSAELGGLWPSLFLQVDPPPPEPPPFELPQEAWAGIAAGVVAVLALLILRFLNRRRREPPPPKVELRIDVSSLPGGAPPAGGPVLEFYNVPVKIAAMVFAPTGRGGDVPGLEKLPALIDQIVPGLKMIYERDRPLIRRWPPQLSVQGFAHTFFANVVLPGDRGKGTPWCSLAGRFEAETQKYLVALVMCAAATNSLGQVVVERDNQWLDMLRVRS